MTQLVSPAASLNSHYGAYDLAALQHLYGTDASEQATRTDLQKSFDGSSASGNLLLQLADGTIVELLGISSGTFTSEWIVAA